MLTVDLVRVMTRSGVIRPRFVDPCDPVLLEEVGHLVSTFETHLGKTRGELDEAIADHIGDSTEFLVQRGLAKLLKDRTTTEVSAAHDPGAVRAEVFKRAAAHWPVCTEAQRAQVMSEAARNLSLSVSDVEQSLYADTRQAERLTAIDLPEPKGLLHRYNLALVQGILLRAESLTIQLPTLQARRARQLFRIIKFHRLMHHARRRADGWELVLDGPLSLFRQTSRYGLQLALLIPSLCHCEQWTLSAQILWGDKRRPYRFELSHESGLVTHTKDRGTWEGDEERHFRKSWERLKTPWRLRRSAKIVTLDQGHVLVPDYTISHPDGRVALLDIIWFWRADTFKRHLERLQRYGPSHLVVALATRLNTDASPPSMDHASVYPFKGVIQPRKLLALVEEVAAKEG